MTLCRCVLVLLAILSPVSGLMCLGDYDEYAGRIAVSNCDDTVSSCGFRCCTWPKCIYCDCIDNQSGLAVMCAALEAAKSLEGACEMVVVAMVSSVQHLARCVQSQVADVWIGAGCGEHHFFLTYGHLMLLCTCTPVSLLKTGSIYATTC